MDLGFQKLKDKKIPRIKILGIKAAARKILARLSL
jgi:hypothetical protein